MRAICLYLHIHQPIRYREYSIFDVGVNSNYFDGYYDTRQSNERIFKKVTEKSYRPMLALLEKNMKKYPNFKVSFSVTGTWLEQAERWAPDLIEQLKRLVSRKQAEIVGETYYHSLAFFHDPAEFEAQVEKHAKKIAELFGSRPKVFRNTELSYNDKLAAWAESKNYKGILAEGWDKILGWRSPNYVYRPAGCKNLKLLTKNYRLSDDIAFRFSNRGWSEWPLTVPKYLDWLNHDCLRGPLINLFMDFETFGEHQWKETGIFDFMNHLIDSWLSKKDHTFLTVADRAAEKPVDTLSFPWTVTWADTERDLSAWMGNKLQDEAMTGLYSLRKKVLEVSKIRKDEKLLEDFRRLTTSDHAYYMCTKYWNDGDVHAYFSAYDSPYDAFMYFLNVLRSLEYRLDP